MKNPSHRIAQTLQSVAVSMRFSRIALGFSRCMVPAMAAAMALFVMDNRLDLPPALRLPLGTVFLLVLMIGLARYVVLPVMRPARLEKIARMMEERLGIPDNSLINAFQFETARLSPDEQPFAEKTILSTQTVLLRNPASRLWDKPRLFQSGILLVLLLASWTFYATLFPQQMTNAWTRFLLPLSDVPPAGDVEIQISPSTDFQALEGENVEIQASLKNRNQRIQHPGTAPVMVWREGTSRLEPSPAAGEKAGMPAMPGQEGRYRFTFSHVHQSFAFRVWVGRAYSPCIRVNVRPLPQIQESSARVVPPAYTGLPPILMPGPPLPIHLLAGSDLRIQLRFHPPVDEVLWRASNQATRFQAANHRWNLQLNIEKAQTYEIEAGGEKMPHRTTITRGEIALKDDQPPEIDFLTEDRNRFVLPGMTLSLELQARDDFGVSTISARCARSDDPRSARNLKTWSYLGPPGNPGPVQERWTFRVDPEVFQPGMSYMLEAVAGDFRPQPQFAISRPLILRVKSIGDLALAPKDALEGFFGFIKKTIAEQTRANGLTQNLRVNLEEAISSKSLSKHQKVMTDQQTAAKKAGEAALAAARHQPEARSYEPILTALVGGEMPWVLDALNRLGQTDAKEMDRNLKNIEGRQVYILTELIALLGKMVRDRNAEGGPKGDLVRTEDATPAASQDAAMKLAADLKEFLQEQKRVIALSKSLLESGPEDLTEKEEMLLTDIARQEANCGSFFQEMLADLSRLPLQDFADGRVIPEVNQVYQEIQAATDALYQKNVTLAVPREQAGLEKASEIIHHLERWLPDTPDHQKWIMEEPAAPVDIPMAELPGELEDIIGDLLDKEEAMNDEIEDVTSSYMDSLDKGAGWDAMDGPISNMSAQGVTGNRLPNQQEVGGRSGEGRNGRSHGQMVGDTAVGKGGRETPTRLTPAPFEPGSVKNLSKEAPGGATGGGKLAGTGEEGLIGTIPPPLQQQMLRIARQQTKLRQEAEALAVRLRKQHAPGGDVETAVLSMKKVEQAARSGNGIAIRSHYHEALDALGAARSDARVERVAHREKNRLPPNYKREILNGLQDKIPSTYEPMVAPYFRSLSEMNE